MKTLLFTTATMLAATGGGQTLAATTFDTTINPAWDGATEVSTFGTDGSQTYGQTFVAPAESGLTSFTFYVDPTGGTVQFTPYVFAWSGSLLGGGGGQAMGAALFSGISTSVTGLLQAVTIGTGELDLTPGAEYVALFTTVSPADNAVESAAGWGDTQFGHAANDGGGGFVYDNNTSLADLTSGDWGDAGDFGDSAWQATFVAVTTTGGPEGGSSVSEPGSLALSIVGVLGLGAIRRCRVVYKSGLVHS